MIGEFILGCIAGNTAKGTPEIANFATKLLEYKSDREKSDRIKRDAESKAYAIELTGAALLNVDKKRQELLRFAGQYYAEKFSREIVNLQEITQTIVNKLKDMDESLISPPSSDWIYEFEEVAKGISEEHLQEILAKVFCMESAKPGSISPRTVQLVKQLGKWDLERFKSLAQCTFYSTINKMSFIPIEPRALPNNVFQDFDSIGLITIPNNKALVIQCGDTFLAGGFHDASAFLLINDTHGRKHGLTTWIYTSYGQEILSALKEPASSKEMKLLRSRISSLTPGVGFTDLKNSLGR